MKTILILCLICLTLSEDSETSQYNKGPAHNYKHEQSEKYCEEYFVYTPTSKWFDDGKSDENVHYHGFMALGSDSLEVIDIAAFYKSEGSEGNESSSNTDDNQDTTTEDGDGN